MMGRLATRPSHRPRPFTGASGGPWVPGCSRGLEALPTGLGGEPREGPSAGPCRLPADRPLPPPPTLQSAWAAVPHCHRAGLCRPRLTVPSLVLSDEPNSGSTWSSSSSWCPWALTAPATPR